MENLAQKQKIKQLQEDLKESDEKDTLISEMRDALKEAMREIESTKKQKIRLQKMLNDQQRKPQDRAIGPMVGSQQISLSTLNRS